MKKDFVRSGVRSGAPALALGAAVAGAFPAAAASPHSVDLAPGGTELSLRAYAMGLMPVDGLFSRVRGRIDFDPGQPGRCSVQVVAEAASLQFDDPDTRADVLSPAMLDAASFPTVSYRGDCLARTVQGLLTLHGQTHPLALTLDGSASRLVATGNIDRTAWGVVGRALTVGRTVRIQFSVTLPDAVRSVLPALLLGTAQ